MSPHVVEHQDSFPPGMDRPLNPRRWGIYPGGGVYHTSPRTGKTYELEGFTGELGKLPHLRKYYFNENDDSTRFTQEEAEKHLQEMIDYINSHIDIFFPERYYP